MWHDNIGIAFVGRVVSVSSVHVSNLYFTLILVSGISCWGFLWTMFSSGHLFWLISHDLHVLVGCVDFEQSALCGEGHFCSQSLPTDPSQSSLSGNYVIVLFLLLLLLKSLLSLLLLLLLLLSFLLLLLSLFCSIIIVFYTLPLKYYSV